MTEVGSRRVYLWIAASELVEASYINKYNFACFYKILPKVASPPFGSVGMTGI
jgi:hypothetical protein